MHLQQHGGGTWKGEEPRELSRQAVGRGWNAGGGGAVAAVDGRLSTAGDQKTQRLVSSPELRKALFPTAIIHVERRRGADWWARPDLTICHRLTLRYLIAFST